MDDSIVMSIILMWGQILVFILLDALKNMLATMAMHIFFALPGAKIPAPYPTTHG